VIKLRYRTKDRLTPPILASKEKEQEKSTGDDSIHPEENEKRIMLPMGTKRTKE
jgi:hypothetical protein